MLDNPNQRRGDDTKKRLHWRLQRRDIGGYKEGTLEVTTRYKLGTNSVQTRYKLGTKGTNSVQTRYKLGTNSVQTRYKGTEEVTIEGANEVP